MSEYVTWVSFYSVTVAEVWIWHDKNENENYEII